VSGFWRTAVDFHASTLNPYLSHVLSLLADGAADDGTVRIDYRTLAWKARSKEQVARRAVASLIEAGALVKVKGGVLRLSDDLLICPGFCPCPQNASTWMMSMRVASEEAAGGRPEGRPGIAPPPDSAFTVIGNDEQNLKALEIDCTVSSLEMAWRDRWKTEPAPGLLRKMVHGIYATDGAQMSSLPAAFREYLSRISDPMYLSLPKFAASWRSYLEPKPKGNSSIAEFDKLFTAMAPAVTDFRFRAIEGETDL